MPDKKHEPNPAKMYVALQPLSIFGEIVPKGTEDVDLSHLTAGEVNRLKKMKAVKEVDRPAPVEPAGKTAAVNASISAPRPPELK